MTALEPDRSFTWKTGSLGEVKDLSYAIQLLSQHPGVKSEQLGPFEIRPVEDMTEVIRASEQRRSGTKSE